MAPLQPGESSSARQLHIAHAWAHALQCGSASCVALRAVLSVLQQASEPSKLNAAVSGCIIFHMAGTPMTSASSAPQRRAHHGGCRAGLCPAPHLCTGQAQCQGPGPLCVSGER